MTSLNHVADLLDRVGKMLSETGAALQQFTELTTTVVPEIQQLAADLRASSPVPAGPPSAPLTSAPGPARRRPRCLRIAECGEVLTDADLAALLQRAPSWPRRERDRARAARVAPNLPARMDIPGQPRYRRVDVESWLKTGSSARTSLRRVG